MTYCVFDIETGIKERFKRKGTPFYGLNPVVMVGWRHKGAAPRTVQELYYGKGSGGANVAHPGWLREAVGTSRLLVGFNIKFDLLHALQEPQNLEFWMQWVADGGQVWDCQLAEYLLNGMGQQDQMLSLDEVAPNYGGNTKFDEVKALWAAGVDTEDIEPSILRAYLCGREVAGKWEAGDVENTERIFLGQLKRAREAGQLNAIMLDMGALLATVEMERNGMFVDTVRGRELAATLAADIAARKAALQQYIPKDLPFEFSWTSRRQLSALIFGGTVPFDRREYQLKDGSFTFEEGHPQQAFVQKDELHYLLNGGATVRCDVFGFSGEDDPREKFKGGKKAGEFKTCKVKADDRTKPKSRMGTDWYTFPGYTAPRKAWETADPGVYSTSAEVIKELAASLSVPFLKELAELQGMTKDLGTYYVVADKDGVESGMLTLVGEDGIVHHQLNMVSTVTGRLSSNSPNLQNIPKGNKSDVKTLFVSRFGPDGKVIQSDFSSLEVYMQAILTACKQLIEDLKAGLDLHVVRLAAKEGMDYDEVFRLAKGYTDEQGVKHPPVKEWDYKRTGAKVYSFQRAFGAGYAKIAASTGMALEEVERLAEAEDARYPEIPAYYEGITAEIKANRRPTSKFVPHPEVRGVMCQLGRSFYRTPDGKLYSYWESPAPEYLVRRGITASFSPTEIRNYVVQGSGGQWAKAAMWLAVREFYRHRNWGGLALLVNQVHDAVYADADAKVAREAAAVLHACMEGASDLMEWFFSWEVPVPVPSDTTWGASMMDEEPIDGLLAGMPALRQGLRDRYMGGYTPTFIH